MMPLPWKHKPECTERECFCADPEESDPICECGCPDWACCCAELEEDPLFYTANRCVHCKNPTFNVDYGHGAVCPGCVRKQEEDEREGEE